jgi:hypothetical protein
MTESCLSCLIDEVGGFVGDFVFRARDGGRRIDEPGRVAGALRLRSYLRRFGTVPLMLRVSLLALKSASSSITKPTSKSSSGSGEATNGRSSMAGNFFLRSSSLARCLLPWPDSNSPVGMTNPSRSSESSSVSVSGSDADVEFEEAEDPVKPSEVKASDDWDEDV